MALQAHGQYKGLQSRIADVAGQLIWCYADVWNLVITEATKSCVPAVCIFNLLQNLATFVKASCKRMAVWIEVVEKLQGQEKMKRLKLIGETRWSGKSNAATTIFGCFVDSSVITCVDLLVCLTMIQESDKFDAKIKYEAKVFHQKFETILTSFTYLYIFETTAPLSKFLQTSGLDMFIAWSLVDTATTKLNEQTRTFDDIHSKAFEFVIKCNEKISQTNLNEHITFQIDALEDALPVKRNKIKMADELASDEGSSSDPQVDFRVSVFYLIMDRIVQSLESRFIQHKQLYKDLSCLDSTNFKTIAEKDLEDEALRGIIKLFPQIIKDQVKLELFSFASNVDVLKLLLNDGEMWAADAPTCERAFSKLKIVKTRLRNSMSEENLESYMLLSIEKEMLDELDSEVIINRFAQSSSELKRLLLIQWAACTRFL
ncbi:uncharacterized protein LOC135211369 [Macrobrachium nipponense]|uniref:uncharacterized protein LOC135211369 n=1 Tax=Macrobrachium nipponense TaxID=159736 RepID=UPI0030C7C413